ncbi:MAG: tetratricopeptide repeat protein [Proteobacteria bacterium]|nr:tetratricopeptide repeat protein [Pseudomonadota bacterium]MBU4384583.1 tetratricopeptide repeat protein [Pseudomonadota bacterium]MBU4606831.1 tetratricopeptide repeat protein [Pseudomonadota bacterium]MCG2766269.1 tetratricopeptide repeat protein [Desulfarculaceae bacterium]
MTGAEILVAKATAKTVIALFKKWHAGYRLDKDIDEVFNRAFDRCPDVVMTACHKDRQFREMLFSLAISKSVDAGKLLEWATVVAAEVYDRAQVCQQLFDFSNELLDQCSVLKRKEAGRVPTVCADFKEQMNILLHGGRANQAAPPEAKQAAPPVYIPHRPNPLLRHYKSWLKQIEAALRTGAAVVNQLDVSQGVALHGQGGLGKTAMAVAYAYEYQGRYPGGVFWVQADLGLGQALAEVANNLGWPLPPEATDQQIIASVLPRLRTQEPKLVILDNLNDKVVPKEIEALPASQLLVTTRLSEVSVGQPVTMGLPTEEEALGIFLAYAELEGKELNQAQQEAAYAICRRAGFLPVALEILGKNARKVPLVDLATALDQAVEQKSTVGTKGQELTIAAALAVTSHNYARPHAKEALLHLAYFYPEELDSKLLAMAMTKSSEEARQLLPEAQAMLAALAEFSVVQPKPDGGYTIHRLVQEAARLEDEDQKAGERLVAILSAQIRNICKQGIYKDGYRFIPHLTHITYISSFGPNNNNLPTNGDLTDWAFFLWQSGYFREAENLVGEVKHRADTLKVPDCLLSAQMTINLALLKKDQGDYREALSLIRGALAIIEEKEGKETAEYAVYLNNYAAILVANDQPQAAEAIFRQVLEIDKNSIGEEAPQYGTHCGNLGEALEKQGKYKEAEKFRRMALDIHRKSLPKHHPYIATGLSNLGLALEKQGKFIEAESVYRQAIKIDEKTIEKNHFRHATLCGNLAGALEGQNKLSEAERLRRLALKIHLEKFGENNSITAASLNNLAQLLAKRGRAGEAINLYCRAMKISKFLSGEDSVDYAIQLNNLGKAYQISEKYTEAEKLYRQAIDICLRALGPEHPNTLAIQKNLEIILNEMKSRT